MGGLSVLGGRASDDVPATKLLGVGLHPVLLRLLAEVDAQHGHRVEGLQAGGEGVRQGDAHQAKKCYEEAHDVCQRRGNQKKKKKK